RHVFDEMRIPAFIVVFVERSGSYRQPHADSPRRRGVRNDRVTQAIFQPAFRYARTLFKRDMRQWPWRRLDRNGRRGSGFSFAKNDDNKKEYKLDQSGVSLHKSRKLAISARESGPKPQLRNDSRPAAKSSWESSA